MDLEKEIKKEEKKIERSFKKINVWMIASIILAVVIIVMVAWPHNISKDAAGQKIVDFAKSQGADVTVLGVNSKDSFYEVNLSLQGKDMVVYITKDGKYFANTIAPLDKVTKTASSSDAKTPASTTVPKTDKPVVEAFVFSYCPYGLQFEKALSPVYDLLKNKADINLVAIGAMHGEYEKIESLREMCIQKNYGKDKLWAYLNKFAVNATIGNCKGDAACLTPLLNPLMSSLSIDKTKIESCMASDAPALYAADGARAQELGISGSPTFVINGVQVQVGRDPQSVKTAICNAFTTAPSECSETLSSTSASPSFGSASTGSASAASCG